jgi:hypothetical protein
MAVVGLLAGISTAMRNAARLTDYDRAVMLARNRMDELMTERRLPRMSPFEGLFDPSLTGGLASGWRVAVTPFEMPPRPAPGTMALDRIELQVWWTSGGERRTLNLEAYRPTVLRPEDVPQP